MPAPGDSPRLGDAGGREARAVERNASLRVLGQDRDLLELMRAQLVGRPALGLGELRLKREIGEGRHARASPSATTRQRLPPVRDQRRRRRRATARPASPTAKIAAAEGPGTPAGSSLNVTV